ncbi:MAG TPA: glycoside hydrolase family 76 protein [Prolixibacteraceae bacterium]|nr:glycoside hydrolase family 76 protein [Prolixibacteraceae bacterium]
MKNKTKVAIVTLAGVLIFSGFQEKAAENDLIRAKATLQQIFSLYNSGHHHLLNETYPYKQDNKASYLVGDDILTGRRVAYLWPTSGVFSGVNALLKTTSKKQYRQLLETNVLPGLQQYYDSVRKPACYQSYIVSAGKSDRFYDDNVWLALDFCESYMLTKKPEYLKKSIETWQFVLSGWDEQLDGGIYWCEQKKHSKNTCSNAPASVLAFKLFEATNDSAYFNWGIRIYNWTKANLQDSTDYLYFDNKNLSGKIGRAKYTYNSGQMLQAAAMIYKLTGEKAYLEDAQHIARSAMNYFTEEFTTAEGKKIRLFKNTGNWFNTILFRGYTELYRLDGNAEYIGIFRDNMDQLWNHIRDKNGLFSKDWKGQKDDEYKWLLDQASLVEIWGTLAEMK